MLISTAQTRTSYKQRMTRHQKFKSLTSSRMRNKMTLVITLKPPQRSKLHQNCMSPKLNPKEQKDHIKEMTFITMKMPTQSGTAPSTMMPSLARRVPTPRLTQRLSSSLTLLQ
ncbi:hypothetical protein BT96DRAFT_175466 [Gymnopus androsaceus JB14]|uniref:Uncharacterized protein n=1 Tax=Gymnopus androsaceus JB14 TaxID=1447944 RepID=A0A6A4I8P9_9AGAR|nr:hypothetical protein BT96DRAFT_175466 [Gymnopus androsaceus JB14]